LLAGFALFDYSIGENRHSYSCSSYSCRCRRAWNQTWI